MDDKTSSAVPDFPRPPECGLPPLLVGGIPYEEWMAKHCRIVVTRHHDPNFKPRITPQRITGALATAMAVVKLDRELNG